MVFSEDNKKHLDYLQAVITRMNTNSFQIKSMAVTIVAALLALYASTLNVLFVFIPILPTMLFWLLDSYYLQQERKFRGVYNNVAGLKSDIAIKVYEMPIHKFRGGKYSYFNVFRSVTIWPVYLPLIILLAILGTCIAAGLFEVHTCGCIEIET